MSLRVCSERAYQRKSGEKDFKGTVSKVSPRPQKMKNGMINRNKKKNSKKRPKVQSETLDYQTLENSKAFLSNHNKRKRINLKIQSEPNESKSM